MMRHGTTLCAALLLLGCSPRTTEDASSSRDRADSRSERTPATVSHEWVEHTSERCRFAVELPGPLSHQPIPPGLLDQIAVEDPLQALTLMASCADVPSVSSSREFLEFTAGVIARQLHARIEERTTIERQGRPGLELSMTIPADRKPPGILVPGDLSYRLRLYVAGTRQYQLHVVHPADAELDDSPQRFLAGFRLLDDAPAAPAPLPWSPHTIAEVTVEAPGTDIPLESTSDDLLTSVRFGAPGRSTPFALSLWKAERSGPQGEPGERLRAHFMLRIATEHAEILDEQPTQIAGRPALDLVVRPNLPLPEQLAPADAEARAIVQDLIDRDPSQLHLRLVLDGERIIQLTATSPERQEDVDRFFGSLLLPG